MMVNVAPDLSSASRSWSGQFHRPTPKPSSVRCLQRHSIGLSRQIISAQAASVKGCFIELDLDQYPAIFDLDRVGMEVFHRQVGFRPRLW